MENTYSPLTADLAFPLREEFVQEQETIASFLSLFTWSQIRNQPRREIVSTAQFVEGKSKIEGYLSRFVGDVGGFLSF